MFILAQVHVQNMEELLEVSNNLISKTSLTFKRYLYDKINWNNRLIGIKGARGVGKTTMLLQWLKAHKSRAHQKAYLSLDELYFTTHNLIDTAKAFYQHGGKVLVLDEVHKYPTWSKEIKNIYDRYPDLQIIFTGASIIDIAKQEADLSRRAVIYQLAGMSYREYLELYHQLSFPALSLDEIIAPKEHLNTFYNSKFKPLQYFQEYLQMGYYPFYKESGKTYHQRINQLVRNIVEYDMAEMKGFDVRHAKKMLQLIYIIAQEVPFKPNINSLSNKTKIHRNTISNYLHFLEEARLIDLLYPPNSSISALQKPEKIYLSNTNLLYALSEETPSIGTVREVFFSSQLNVSHRLRATSNTDFLVDDNHFFEIGGKKKSGRQIAALPNAWVVRDDMEYPAGKYIPLWLFGFLY